MKELTNEQLILELYNRGLLTNASHHNQIVEELNNGEKPNIQLVLTKGIPVSKAKCSKCRKTFDACEFGYYQARVSSKGYLQRSNALCSSCRKDHGTELKEAIAKAGGRPPEPKAGSVCPHCEREWDGKWHLHHRGDKIIGYICGHCNMSFSDHRNEEVNKKRNRKFDFFLDKPE